MTRLIAHCKNYNNRCRSSWPQSKTEGTMEHGSDTNCNKWTRYSHQRIDKGTGGLGNKRTSGDHSNNSIIKICQNTEKSPGDLRRLAVRQIPVKSHQLMLVWKTIKESNNNNNNNTADCSLRNRKDAAKDPEAQESYFTQISTSSTKARPYGKTYLWFELTSK